MLNYKITNKNNKNFNILIENETETLSEKINLSMDEINLSENIDNEIELIKNITEYELNLNFFSNGFHYNNFGYNGFTIDDIENKSKFYRYSSVSLFIYDKPEIDSQTLAHISYIPLYHFNIQTQLSNLKTKITDEYNFYYLNKGFTKDKIYFARFYFFNSRTGIITPFFNKEQPDNNDLRLYYPLYINSNNEAYFFQNELNLFEIENSEYKTKLNNNTPKEVVIKPNFNDKEIFTIEGRYQ